MGQVLGKLSIAFFVGFVAGSVLSWLAASDISRAKIARREADLADQRRFNAAAISRSTSLKIELDACRERIEKLEQELAALRNGKK